MADRVVESGPRRMLYSKENQEIAGRWLALAAGAAESAQLQLSDLERDLRGLAEDEATAALEVLAALRASAESAAGA